MNFEVAWLVQLSGNLLSWLISTKSVEEMDSRGDHMEKALKILERVPLIGG